jgi:hypothetical protein
VRPNGRERARALRRLGVTGSIAAFLVAFAIVFGQLVIGDDSALGRGHKAQTQTKARAKAKSKATSEETTSSQTAPAPVTTAQS